MHGGTDGIRTRVDGFADRCLTPRPPRHRLNYNKNSDKIIGAIIWCSEEDLNLHERNAH